MRYFYDTEFIEDGKTIDLISIGIVAQDGREYYAQSVEFDPAKASGWVREHVLSQLKVCHPSQKWNLDPSLYSWQRCEKEDCPWRTREEIKQELLAFMDVEKYGTPELWGYYADYDHIALAQLFGTMMDLPKGWPMYTRDLKQWADQLGTAIPPHLTGAGIEGEHHALFDAERHQRIYWFLDECAHSQAKRKKEGRQISSRRVRIEGGPDETGYKVTIRDVESGQFLPDVASAVVYLAPDELNQVELTRYQTNEQGRISTVENELAFHNEYVDQPEVNLSAFVLSDTTIHRKRSIAQARAALQAFVSGKEKMCIPAQKDDSDIILADIIDELAKFRGESDGKSQQPGTA